MSSAVSVTPRGAMFFVSMKPRTAFTTDDPSHPELYEVVSGKGERLEILSPAYVEEMTGRVIRQGRARAVHAEASSAESESSDHLVAVEPMPGEATMASDGGEEMDQRGETAQ